MPGVFWPLFMALIMRKLRVLITRPLTQAEPWAAALSGQGIETRCVPVLALQAVSDDAGIQAIKNCILDFDLYRKVIFVSLNAVAFAMEWLENYWPQLPTGIEYFAVGDTTARALASYGLNVGALEATQQGAMTSETLLDAGALQEVAGEKILIFRGKGGRGYMGEILRARDASVDYCELYHRVIPAQAAAELMSLVSGESSWLPDIVALHSGESLSHFVQVLDNIASRTSAAKVAEILGNTPVLVPGQRVAELAMQAGFEQVIVAENATDPAMTQALEHFASARSSSFSD